MTLKKELIEEMVVSGRSTSLAEAGDEALGPLGMLPGTWENTKELDGFGFNMMALPFADDPTVPPNGYRLLMNQYNEVLDFSLVDKGVPNRGLDRDPVAGGADQTIVALEYFQKITQLNSDDSPQTGLNDRFDKQAIHKEPGLWLYMTDHQTDGINIARLGTIPHGNSFLAAGRVDEDFWPLQNPTEDQRSGIIPNINGVVVGGGEDPDEVDLEPAYFAPYKHFHENPFKGKVNIPGYNGFDPVHATDLLRLALEKVIASVGEIKQVMRLHVDSTTDHSGVKRFTHNGIVNIPFVVRQADATAMNSTFLIYEVLDKESGKTRYFMQYAQNVILDFIGRPDGHPGRARWPHISINTMERVGDASKEGVMKGLLSQ
ncbi:MAG: hypothetical protein GKR93_04455 [Gammaproteobacteria bacterium]|nr:hypothetical protein [Gammaproteobacteria bacterium]